MHSRVLSTVVLSFSLLARAVPLPEPTSSPLDPTSPGTAAASPLLPDEDQEDANNSNVVSSTRFTTNHDTNVRGFTAFGTLAPASTPPLSAGACSCPFCNSEDRCVAQI